MVDSNKIEEKEVFEGFIKVNFKTGFHSYLDKLGNIINVFYKKNNDLTIRVKDHIIQILGFSKEIKEITICLDHIRIKYVDIGPIKASNIFYGFLEEITNCIDDNILFSRVGHALHIVYFKNFKELLTNLHGKRLFHFNQTIERNIRDTIFYRTSIESAKNADNNKDICLLKLDRYNKKEIKQEQLQKCLLEISESLNDNSKYLQELELK